MKKVTEAVVTAFLNGEKKEVGNTSTNGTELFLFDNLIARKSYESQPCIEITLAGWNTVTTRDRLQAVLTLGHSGNRISTRKGQALFDGEPIDDNEWIKIKPSMSYL